MPNTEFVASVVKEYQDKQNALIAELEEIDAQIEPLNKKRGEIFFQIEVGKKALKRAQSDLPQPQGTTCVG
ncbi:MAG TPA: hypothetical protein VE973_00460 [Candidatus Limnocylindria bacterium]|nr:hypothetical protein [Candidatus Limnocylindria bacterium]